MNPTTIPSALKNTTDYDNQVSSLIRPRRTEFLKPNGNISLSNTGGDVVIPIGLHNSLINLKDCALSFDVTITNKNVSDVIDRYMDFTHAIDSIKFSEQTNDIFYLSNAWAISEFFSYFRGTEEIDLTDMSDAIENHKITGNALLYTVRASVDADSSKEYKNVTIPMNRFGDFFDNEALWLSKGAQLTIKFNNDIGKMTFKDAATSDTVDSDDVEATISNIQFKFVNYNLEGPIKKEYLARLSSVPKTIAQKWYYVHPAAISGGVPSTVYLPFKAHSVDRVGLMFTYAGSRNAAWNRISSLDVVVNGHSLKQSGINNTVEALHMTLESANMTSNQLTSMRPIVNREAHCRDDSAGGIRSWVYLFTTAFEDEDNMRTGIDNASTDQEFVQVTVDATGNSLAQIYLIAECSGFLETTSERNLWHK